MTNKLKAKEELNQQALEAAMLTFRTSDGSPDGLIVACIHAYIAALPTPLNGDIIERMAEAAYNTNQASYANHHTWQTLLKRDDEASQECIDNYRDEAKAALAASGLLAQWQPIETYKHGEAIFYQPAVQSRMGPGERICIDNAKPYSRDTTHWMPLPPKPTTKSEVI